MGSHRAETRASRDRHPVTQPTPPYPASQPGKRAARRTDRRAASTSLPRRAAARTATPVAAPVIELQAVVEAPRRSAPGRRSAPRKSLIRGLPSAPLLLGIAALAISAGGAVTLSDPQLVGAAGATSSAKLMQAGALSGTGGVASSVQPGARGPVVSRDASRDQLATSVDPELVAAAEAQAKEVAAARQEVDKQTDQYSAKLKQNLWHLPVVGYHLTARFGDYGLWSSYHTGLDFAAPSGTPIYAVANGVISSASYDGSYGNKTVETLDDGTELWYCHQTSFTVSSGETVRAGELIGYIGSTGHVTGPHLHLEVHPGGGDPVDPYTALVVHGVTP
jgi:murein DD-endopeptidase MepM/ murein hydrolase activator NlpD